MTNLRILATDMDGTFIPLEENEQNRQDLTRLQQTLAEHEIDLMYVTGRHLEIVLDVIDSDQLPRPHWVVCDVGTSIYQQQPDGQYKIVQHYVDHLQRRAGQLDDAFVQSVLDLPSVRMQEEQKQGLFKRSYYCDAQQVEELAAQVDAWLTQHGGRYHSIPSVDPFTGDGLIDLLPQQVSKAYALAWWTEHVGQSNETIVFAGDSGNDVAALTAGYRSIVVSNADRAVADKVRQHHLAQDWQGRLFLATQPATSGVLEGLKYFLGE